MLVLVVEQAVLRFDVLRQEQSCVWGPAVSQRLGTFGYWQDPKSSWEFYSLNHRSLVAQSALAGFELRDLAARYGSVSLKTAMTAAHWLLMRVVTD